MTLATLDAVDRSIVKATQAGLPLVPRPYAAVAEALGLTAEEVMRRMQRMLDSGVIRRIGAVPNHYALGLDRNAMTVWDVADADVDRLGPEIGAFEFVTHCYRRPRALPIWPYNLFAMVHGRTDEEVAAKIAIVESHLGESVQSRDVLMSKRILKKTGMRLAA